MNGKLVEFYFSVDSIRSNKPEIVEKIEVVDRYMLKLKDGLWIQKHLLAGVSVR